MKIATLYDIHGNAPALEAVLTELKTRDVDTIIVGGDVVAGPMPNECLDLLNDFEGTCYYILGNSESDVLTCLSGNEVVGLTPGSAREAVWVAGELSETHKQSIALWSDTVSLEVDGIGKILFCHASPRNNVDVFTATASDQRLNTLFGQADADVVICGHTHMQFELELGNTRILNAGSVGMSFGRKGLYWLLIDDDIHFMRSNYDTNAAATRIKASNYHSADDFVANNILTVPDEADVLTFLSGLEAKQLAAK